LVRFYNFKSCINSKNPTFSHIFVVKSPEITPVIPVLVLKKPHFSQVFTASRTLDLGAAAWIDLEARSPVPVPGRSGSAEYFWVVKKDR
jgi:hypothetical protein